jgi:hypothetical protein
VFQRFLFIFSFQVFLLWYNSHHAFATAAMSTR